MIPKLKHKMISAFSIHLTPVETWNRVYKLLIENKLIFVPWEIYIIRSQEKNLILNLSAGLEIWRSEVRITVQVQIFLLRSYNIEFTNVERYLSYSMTWLDVLTTVLLQPHDMIHIMSSKQVRMSGQNIF